ncbi:hypothetical protein [Roseateles sp.]|uniref:hypothetical protein n=1 Tax=Roseateles sp. TaxID=1971397 RepID=UPI00286D4597|nr:hypothetical protein [Roseateles sp.]
MAFQRSFRSKCSGWSIEKPYASWYLHTYKQTPDGWKFLKSGGKIMWAAGEKFVYLTMIDELAQKASG